MPVDWSEYEADTAPAAASPTNWAELEPDTPDDSYRPGSANPAPVDPLAGVKLSPYEQADYDSEKAGLGKPYTGMEAGTELTSALAGSAMRGAGNLLSLPGKAMDVLDKGLTPKRLTPKVPLSDEEQQIADQFEQVRRQNVAAHTSPPRTFREWATTPAVPFKKNEIHPDDSVVQSAGREIYNQLVSLPEFASTPLGLGAAATGGLGGGAAVRVGFLADMAKSLFGQAPALYQNWDKMTPAERTKSTVDFLGTAGMVKMLAKGHGPAPDVGFMEERPGAGGNPLAVPDPGEIASKYALGDWAGARPTDPLAPLAGAVVPPRAGNDLQEPQVADVPGAVLRRPAGAVPPRGEPAPGIETVSPGESLARAQQMTDEATASGVDDPAAAKPAATPPVEAVPSGAPVAKELVTAQSLVGMTPEAIADWKQTAGYGPDLMKAMASQVKPEDLPAMVAERDRMRSQYSAQLKSLEKMDLASPEAQAIWADSQNNQLKAQTLNEMVENAPKPAPEVATAEPAPMAQVAPAVSRVAAGKALRKLVETDRDLAEQLAANHPMDLRLNEDGSRVIMDADSRSRGPKTGGSSGATTEFINWLMTTKGEGIAPDSLASHMADVNRAREIISGKNVAAEPPAANAGSEPPAAPAELPMAGARAADQRAVDEWNKTAADREQAHQTPPGFYTIKPLTPERVAAMDNATVTSRLQAIVQAMLEVRGKHSADPAADLVKDAQHRLNASVLYAEVRKRGIAQPIDALDTYLRADGEPVAGARPIPTIEQAHADNLPFKAKGAIVEYDVNQQIIDTGLHPTGKKAKAAEIAALKERQTQVVQNFKDAVKPAETAPSAPAAVAQVKAQVQKVAATEGQRPAKAVKSELVARLEKAIEDAPAAADLKTGETSGITLWPKGTSEKVTIDIPGDGTFTVPNAKESLGEVLVRANRISTTAGTPKTAPKVGGVGDLGEQADAAAKAYGSPESAYGSAVRQRDSLQAQGPPNTAAEREAWNKQVQAAGALVDELYSRTKPAVLEREAEAQRERIATYTEGAKGFEAEIAKVEAIKRKTQGHRDKLEDLRFRYAQNQEFLKNATRKAAELEQQAATEKAALEARHATPAEAPAPKADATKPAEPATVAPAETEPATDATTTPEATLDQRRQAVAAKVDANQKLTPAEKKIWDAMQTGPKADEAPQVEAGPSPSPSKGIGASVRRKWASATDDKPLGSEAGFFTLAPLKDLLDRVGPAVRASIEAVRNAARENFDVRKSTDYRRSVLNWSAKLQRSFGEAAEAQKEIRDKVRDPVRRAAITNWIQAGGDPAVLRQRAIDTDAWRDPATGKPHPQQKQLVAGYEAALHLTPEELSVANDAKAAYDALLNRGMHYGVIQNFKDNYVTQIWDLGKSPRPKPPGSGGGSRMLKDRFKFSKASTFDTFFDGEQAGYVPKTKDISALLPVYLHEMNSVIAARQLVEQMSKGTASDGKPLLAPRGVGVTVGGPSNQATLVLPDVPQNAAKGYVIIENQPALHEWRWVTKDSAGNPVFNKSDLMVHPEVAAHLKNVLGKSAISEWYNSKTSAAAAIPKALVKGLDMTQSETKRTMLGLLTPFHQVQEGTHAIGHKVNPFFNNPKIDLVNDAAQMDAARHGLMLLPDRASENMFMEGFRQSGVISHVPGLGPLADHYSNYLFHEYIPGIKYKTYQAILERNSKRYAADIASGRATASDVKILSAEQANAAYGHLNYADLGRNPTIGHLARLALLAPDFLEARARFAGQAIKGATGSKVGREQLIALGTLAVAQATLSWTSAKLTGGQWDEKDPFSFHVGNQKFTMRSVPEDLYRGVKDHRAFWYARLSPLVGRGALQYLSGTDWRGQKVGAGQTTKELLQQPIPLALRPLFGIGNTSLSGWEELAGAAGLKISRYSPVAEIQKSAHQWMAASSDPKIKAEADRMAKTTMPQSDYAPLREALEREDYSGAQRAYRALRETHSSPQISDAMNQHRPFSGDAATERKFKASLDEDGKRLYEEAVKSRHALYQRYLQVPK